MPAAQSTTPDYFLKSGVANALIAEDLTVSAPSWATTCVAVIRGKGSTSTVTATGSIGPGNGPTAEVDTTVTGLAVGLYDLEWLFTDGGTKSQRLPANTWKLLEIVENLS